MPLLAHGAADHLQPITFQPVPIALLLLACVLFLRARAQLAARGRAVPRSQTVCWFSGLLLVAIGLLSPLDALGANDLVSAHMAQHLLIADLSAPLLLIGARAPLLYFLWPRPVLVTVARSPLRAVWNVLTKPPVALALWLTTLAAWHVPSLYEAALEHRWAHDAEHLSFVLGSMLAWWPLLEPTHHRLRGRAWKAVYVVAARTLGGILGGLMLLWPKQLYPWYGDRAYEWGLSPLADQQLAGGAMMTVDLAIVIVGVVVFVSAMGRPDDEPSVTE